MGIIMKLFVLSAALAVKIEGVDGGNLQSGNHWRKPWPQGIDNGDDDGDILGRFNKKDPAKIKEEKKETYPWEYDKDVIDTGKSIEKGEEIKKGTLTYGAVA